MSSRRAVPSSSAVTRTRACSPPMPKRPGLPALSTSIVTSLRFRPSSSRAISIASSTVFALTSTLSMGRPLSRGGSRRDRLAALRFFDFRAYLLSGALCRGRSCARRRSRRKRQDLTPVEGASVDRVTDEKAEDVGDDPVDPYPAGQAEGHEYVHHRHHPGH